MHWNINDETREGEKVLFVQKPTDPQIAGGWGVDVLKRTVRASGSRNTRYMTYYSYSDAFGCSY